jgi:hypothetical protein
MLSHVPSAQVLAATAACLALLLFQPPSRAAGREPEATASPMGGGGSAVLERVPEKPVAAATHRIVFTCVAPGLITFSDRPCGPLPDRREIEVLPATASGGGAASSVAPPPARASTRPAVVAGNPEPPAARRATKRPQDCQPLRQAVTAIDRQMRAGYSAREAPRLWERWREARDRLHAAGCG